MKCLTCGWLNRSDAKFCKHCGKPLFSPVQRPVGVPQPMPGRTSARPSEVDRMPAPPPTRKSTSPWTIALLSGGTLIVLLLCLVIAFLIVTGAPNNSTVAENLTATRALTSASLTPSIPTASAPTPSAVTTPSIPTARAATLAIPSSTPAPVIATSPRSNKSPSTSDQQLVSEMLGQPSFFIVNMAPSDANAATTIQATWYFPQRQVSYSFIDGAYVGSDDILALPAGLRLPAAHPDQFRPGMTAAEVNQALGAQPTVNHKAPNSVLEDTEFNFYPGIEVAFQKGRLVYVKTYPFDATTSERFPVPSASSPPRLVMLAYHPESVYTRPLDVPDALLPDPSSILGTGKEIYDLYSSIKGFYDTGNLVGLTAEIQGAVKFLREQQADSETDPIKKATLLNAANLARLRANGIENEVVPTLQSQQRGYACSKFPLVGSMLIRFGCGEKPDPDRLRKLFNEYLGDVKGRPGQVRGALQQWITDATGNWDNLPPSVRESVVTSLISDRLREMCGMYERNTDEYRSCRDRALNTLRQQFAPLNTPGNAEIINEVNRLSGVRPTETPTETATSTATPTFTTTPTATKSPLPTGCPLPEIEFFTANPTTITVGQSSALSWGRVTNANSAEIDQGIGGVPAPSSVQVRPSRTTVYTLVANGCGGTTRRQATVNVVSPPSNTPTRTATLIPPIVLNGNWWMGSDSGTIRLTLDLNTGSATAVISGGSSSTYFDDCKPPKSHKAVSQYQGNIAGSVDRTGTPLGGRQLNLRGRVSGNASNNGDTKCGSPGMNMPLSSDITLTGAFYLQDHRGTGDISAGAWGYSGNWSAQ